MSTTNATPKCSTHICAYCTRPSNAAIVANNAVYCGKLCAALGLIAEVDREDGIEWGVGSFEALLGSIAAGDELPLYPVRMRWSEADNGPNDERAVVVAIDDDKTPDWIPETISHPEQAEIDRVVDDLLRNTDAPEGRV